MTVRLFSILLLLAATAASAQTPGPFATFDAASGPVLNGPQDLAMGPDGLLYIADKFADRITVMDPETLEVVRYVGAGKMLRVSDISISPDGRALAALTGGGGAMLFDGLSTADPEPVGGYRAKYTAGALIHSTGRLFVVATALGVLGAFDGSNWVGGAPGHVGAHDVAEAPNGDVWLADISLQRLVRYSKDLEYRQTLDGAKFGFISPQYMDVDPWGRLIVADEDTHQIFLIDPDGPEGGTLLGVLGDGVPGNGPNKFNEPEGVLADAGRYFFADSGNNRIVRYVVVLN
ncbi:MAG: hypothetical protein AAF401_09215 [Pseudomonadota bacterium]